MLWGHFRRLWELLGGHWGSFCGPGRCLRPSEDPRYASTLARDPRDFQKRFCEVKSAQWSIGVSFILKTYWSFGVSLGQTENDANSGVDIHGIDLHVSTNTAGSWHM